MKINKQINELALLIIRYAISDLSEVIYHHHLKNNISNSI